MPKPPQAVFDSIYAFPPNRDTLGGTAYFIVGNSIDPDRIDPLNAHHGNPSPARANILIDCPPWTPETQDFLTQQGGVRWWIFTHRSSFGPLKAVRALQAAFSAPVSSDATGSEQAGADRDSSAVGCELVVQEQEAYLLPNLPVTTFREQLDLAPDLRVIWTPGHTPGSSCVWFDRAGGILFSGRHLLPTPQGELMPLKTAKTFHWFRQLRSVQGLIDRFSATTLAHCCPGANIGFLRGALSIDQAYGRLTSLNLAAARLDPVALQSPTADQPLSSEG
ncbi:MAG: MBL fold metallo-hydrolase [Oscillatoriales cyanobacterium]|nr:MAG: MBL fold metallo-hydrolase [Oscillatoriales cyanobacterium]